jgi:hypothetical protein
MPGLNVITARNSAMPGLTASNLPTVCVCGMGVITYTRSAREKDNAAPIPTCCNCKLVDEQVPQPSYDSDHRYARDEIQK